MRRRKFHYPDKVAMSVFDLYALFLLGIAGTGHCIGMCGPLVLAFPGRIGHVGAHLYYHTGRVCTYVAIGAAMGALGQGLRRLAGHLGGDPLGTVARTQVLFSVLVAVFLFFLGLCRLGLVREPAWLAVAAPSKIPGHRSLLKAGLGSARRADMFRLGLLFGFLPCGLSYAAFARALAADGMARGGLLVLMFGLGTVPGLLFVGTGVSRVARRYARHSDIISGMLMIAMAILLGAGALQALFSVIQRAGTETELALSLNFFGPQAFYFF